MLNWTPVAEAAWFGLPRTGWPGLDISFDARFLGLLVPFIIVTIIGAVETYGHAIAIQRVSHRTAAPVDFKVVQRALNADGVGNLLSGLAGTVPNSTYSASISIADLTGVAARRVALWGGIIIVLTASIPKLPALLQVVPSPVAGAYVFVFMVLLFRQGVRLVTAGGFSYERGLVVCISFWVGLGFQFGVIFPDHLPQWSRGVLDNGMAAGGIVAMVLTLLVSLRQSARHDVLEPSVRSLPTLRAALDRAAERAGWDEVAVNRLQLAGEEAFLYLLERQEESKPQPVRVAVRPVDDVLQIELVAGPDDVNLEDERPAVGGERARVTEVLEQRLLDRGGGGASRPWARCSLGTGRGCGGGLGAGCRCGRGTAWTRATWSRTRCTARSPGCRRSGRGTRRRCAATCGARWRTGSGTTSGVRCCA